jgi:8-oxo-dGTP pyrophosphatase MutT (NUDIX family)
MDFQKIIHSLEKKLQQPLPGEKAHNKMAAQHRTENFNLYKPNKDTKEGGVLLLLYPTDKEGVSEIHIPLIQRPSTERGVHSGQVSFPGGKKEPLDTNLIETALRECYEEIGVETPKNQVIGLLSPLFVFASNFMVQPVVAFLEKKPTFFANAGEVEQVLEISLEHIKKLENQKTSEITIGKYVIQAPYFDVQEKIVWGATAMILSELLEVMDTL